MHLKLTFPSTVLLLLWLAVTSINVAEAKATIDNNSREGEPASSGSALSSDSARLSDAQCLTALTQCPLIDIRNAEYGDIGKNITDNEVAKVHMHYKVLLGQLKQQLINLIDHVIENPSSSLLPTSCELPVLPEKDLNFLIKINNVENDTDGDNSKETMTHKLETTITTTSNPTTTQATTAATGTTLAARCNVNEWSEWSSPLGFGTRKRVRVITQPGHVCPEAQLLVEYRQINISITYSPEGDAINPVDNVQHVSENFFNDFIRASEGKPRDLMLLIDSSGSISDAAFQVMKIGIKLLIDVLCGGFGLTPYHNRLSILQFSSNVVGRVPFGSYQDPDTLKAIVDSMQPMYEYTCTGDALTMAYQAFDPKYGARSYSAHDALVITDGQSNCGANLLASSRLLQQRSNVYALAIGLSSDPAARSEITSMVSNQDPRHLFSLVNFYGFQSMVENVQEKQKASPCQPITIQN